VIMGEMEDTRKDLAEKLESLEKKVAGTVETVTGTVQTVENTVENVKESIQETVASVTDTVQNTVQAVEDTVSSTVSSVKSFFDVSYQVDRHPWFVMGGSVLIGYLGGWLLTPRSRRTYEASPARPTYTPTPPADHNGAGYAASPPPAAPAAREPEQTAKTSESWLSRLGERLAPEVDKLKGLAVGTLFSVARDLVSRFLPDALKDQVTEVINNFTTDLGGKVIRDPLVGPSEQRSDGRTS